MPRTPPLWQRDFFLVNCLVLRSLLASERSGVVKTFRYPLADELSGSTRTWTPRTGRRVMSRPVCPCMRFRWRDPRIRLLECALALHRLVRDRDAARHLLRSLPWRLPFR